MAAQNPEQATIFYRQLEAINRIHLEKYLSKRRHLAKVGVSIERLGGNTPIIIEGTLGKKRRFLLRLRGDYWYFHVHYNDCDLYQNDVYVSRGEHGFGIEGGWLLKHQAVECLEKALAGFRLDKPRAQTDTATERLPVS